MKTADELEASLEGVLQKLEADLIDDLNAQGKGPTARLVAALGTPHQAWLFDEVERRGTKPSAIIEAEVDTFIRETASYIVAIVGVTDGDALKKLSREIAQNVGAGLEAAFAGMSADGIIPS